MASEDLRRLRVARGYTKASITRLFNFSNNENDVGLSAISNLETKRARIGELFKDYEQCNKEILALDEADAEDVEDYEAKYYNILTILNEAIKNKSSSSDAPSSDAPASSCKKAKLPTIKIETFTGKYREYTGFINLFKAIIHNDRSIDNVQKLYYLRSFLANEPFDLIKNLPLAEGSYEEALKLLEERYNHKFKIVNEHINALLDINALVKSNPANLRQFVSCIKQSLSALKNLNVTTDNWNPIILAILYRKLDTYTSRAYQLERDDTEEPTVTEFLLYLEKRALALENAEPSPTPGKSYHKAVVNVTATASPACSYCKSNHRLFDCSKFKMLTSSERIAFSKNNDLCSVCLNKHNGKCRFHFRCSTCKQAHNTLLHPDSANQPQVSLISNLGHNGVLLPTVRVKLYSRTGSEVHVKALLDCCSQSSLATTKLINVLGLTPSKDNSNIIGAGGKSTDTQYSIPLDVYSLTMPYRVTANCNVMEKITCQLPQNAIKLDAINIPDGITLSDADFHQPSEINLLLGADIFFQVLLLEPVPGQQERSAQPVEDPASPHPTVVNTKFGYIIGGGLPRQQTSDKSKVTLLCTQCDSSLNDSLQNFWNVESIPETFCERMSEHQMCEDTFKSTTVLENNKFQVDLPLKVPLNEVNDVLGSSFDMAYYRFLNLEKRLHKNINLLSDYEKFINEYVDLKHGHYIDFNQLDFENDPLYFASHHAVINDSSKTTCTRVVFDCSLQTNKRVSLNDILLNGPPVQKELFDIMLLFRLGNYTFSTDIRRMFRCVDVNPMHF
ncbi:uncharacterized protein LOC134790325 [Cydia splendana]|uniref:uncharacterized protein LOC134790325 n=1 Tax=Cydia splendana TaxID=1100963 RepID=UPI00300CC33E